MIAKARVFLTLIGFVTVLYYGVRGYQTLFPTHSTDPVIATRADEEQPAPGKKEPPIFNPASVPSTGPGEGENSVLQSLWEGLMVWCSELTFHDLKTFTVVQMYWWLIVTTLRMGYVMLGNALGICRPGDFRLFLALFPWSYVWRWYRRLLWRPVIFWIEELFWQGRKATARFASVWETMTLVYRPGRVYLGQLRAYGIGLWQSIGVSVEKHLVMIAGTGGGKTTLLISMLALHNGTAFVIDPKAQIAKVLARFLSQFMKVCVLDPRGIAEGQASASWNCFDEMTNAVKRQRRRNQKLRKKKRQRGRPPAEELRRPIDRAIAYASKIAYGLVIRYGKENPVWANSARDFLLGLILYVYAKEPPDKRNLVRLYELLCNGLPEKTPPGKNPSDVLVYHMTKCRAFGGRIAGSANTLASMGKEMRGSVIGTLMEQLRWLKDADVRHLCERSSFGLEELKTGKLMLFLCAPVTDIREDLAGWFRLLTVIALTVFEELQAEKIKRPCLFALDEFPSLGKIEALASAAAVMRSFGVRLLCIAQDIGQIKNLYENWQTFIGSAAVTWWMSISDPDSLAFLEKKLGQARIRRRLGKRWYWPFSRELARIHEDEHLIMTADQIERFLSPARGNMIVQRSGERPLKLKVAPYFKTLPVWYYDADTDYREKRLRAFTRKLLTEQAPRLLPLRWRPTGRTPA